MRKCSGSDEAQSHLTVAIRRPTIRANKKLPAPASGWGCLYYVLPLVANADEVPSKITKASNFLMIMS